MISSPPAEHDPWGREGAPALDTTTQSARDEVLDRLARLAALTLESPMTFVAIAAGDDWSVRSRHGFPDGLGESTSLPVPGRLLEEIRRSGTAVMIGDWGAHPFTATERPPCDSGRSAVLALPFASPIGPSSGALCVIHDELREWSERDVAILTDLAAAASAELQA